MVPMPSFTWSEVSPGWLGPQDFAHYGVAVGSDGTIVVH